MPQGTNQTVEKALLQAPGVSQDSAASGLLHVRNDHANVQFRINGVMLPDGVTGFGSIFDTSFIGSIALITGALPAEFGMRTVGLVDITTRTDLFNNSGTVGVYGGSQGMITPYMEYGGTFGSTCPTVTPPPGKPTPPPPANCFPGVQYYFTGRYLQTNEGLENATPSYFPIHDFSRQGKGFAYISTFIDPTTRISMIEGTAYSTFQIPNVPGQPVGLNGNPPVTSVNGITNFNSAALNENQVEFTQYGVLAVQKSVNGFDGQLSYFTRYNRLQFIPDPVGDLLLNGIASDITRQSYANGIQGDGSYQAQSGAYGPRRIHRQRRTGLRRQFFAGRSGPRRNSFGHARDDNRQRLEGRLACRRLRAGRMEDHEQLHNQRRAALRPDVAIRQRQSIEPAHQLHLQAVRLHHLPRRLCALFHAAGPGRGGAREYRPVQWHHGRRPLPGPAPCCRSGRIISMPASIRKYRSDATTRKAKDCTALTLGVDAYYKIATDLIDNGNFGQALVLSAFNYAQGYVEGIEFSGKFHSGNFQAYANLALGEERATNVVSNQYLFDNTVPLADLGGLTLQQYVDSHWIYTDHTQLVTGSAGVAYKFCGRPAYAGEMFNGLPGADGISWCGIRLSADMIYGSGLRSGDANISTVPPYTQFNVGVAREFLLPDDPKPMTVRFDIVNLFDTLYLIRSGTGIGVFAPQYGPRLGFFVGVSKKI